MFSPDSSRVLTTSQDKTAKLWDAAEGKPLADKVKYISRVTLGDPQNAFAAKDSDRKVLIEERLKLVHRQRLI